MSTSWNCPNLTSYQPAIITYWEMCTSWNRTTVCL